MILTKTCRITACQYSSFASKKLSKTSWKSSPLVLSRRSRSLSTKADDINTSSSSNNDDDNKANKHFDVTIVGGGAAGSLMARLLSQNTPSLKVSVIDFRTPKSGEEVLGDSNTNNMSAGASISKM